MVSLLKEYMDRHQKFFLLAPEDSVAFFNDKDGKPFFIATVDNVCRTRQICWLCESSSTRLVLETLEYSGSLFCSSHYHIKPDCNLFDFLKKTKYTNYKLFIPEDHVEKEVWLWNYFVSHFKKMYHNLKFIKKNKKEGYTQRYITSLYDLSLKSEHLYREYTGLYSDVITDRKYIG